MTIKWPDLSHYKTGVDVSKWPALITKATEGSTYVDPTYASYKAAAATAGIPFLPYHFLHHGNIAAQVAHVVATVGARTLMLDVESEPNAADSTLADVEAFMDAYAARGGRVVLNYIPKWYWSGHWHSPSLKPLEARGAGLISSQYTTYSDTGPGWGAYGGVTPIIWQYTSTPMDMNAFRGTPAQLADLFAGTSGQGSTVTTGDDDMATVVTVPAGYSNAGHQVDAGTALTMLLSMQLDTRNRVIKAAASADPKALAAELAPLLPAGALSQAEIEAALRNVFADAAS